MLEKTTFEETASLPRILVTSVGSLPHTDPEQAVDLIMDSLHACPHAPQLPRVDPREQMWIQFAENLPRFRLDLKNLNYYFDTSGDCFPEIEEFYSQYLRVEEGWEPDYFGVGQEYGRGIKAFIDRISLRGKKLPFIKVQVTGPLSFSLTVTDETRKPIFYHPIFRDVAVKAMGLKAVWLMEKCKPFAEKVIVFFDEPSLSAYGSSAFLGVSQADVVESLNDVMNMVAARGGIPGVHCCGNTDWGMLMETSGRIINFDAVDYLESLAIYTKELSQFLERGGVLAWGAVRNTERIREESSDDVIRRLNDGLTFLNKNGVNRTALMEKIILTPACGCAGLAVSDATEVYRTLSELESKNF
ncbi:MAG: hypothetical protein WCG29_06960 [Desulfomonile sp.]